MSVITLLVILVVLALVWWLLSTYILPRLPEPFRTVIIIVIVVVAILFLLSLIGIGPGVRL